MSKNYKNASNSNNQAKNANNKNQTSNKNKAGNKASNKTSNGYQNSSNESENDCYQFMRGKGPDPGIKKGSGPFFLREVPVERIMNKLYNKKEGGNSYEV